jgi:hypothetical protein
MDPFSQNSINQLRKELTELDHEMIEVNGKQLKPSQCYRFGTDPAHLLFNTNCPPQLKTKIEAILKKYSIET